MRDVVIVGAGPAGLSAALLLGRCNRWQVTVVDSGRYRNAASEAVHGFLTRDGIAPSELRRLARHQLQPYGVEVVSDLVEHAEQDADGFFSVALRDAGVVQARKLVLASGVVDQLPLVAGLGPLFGKSVFLCPYCDGWEFRGRPLGVLGADGAQLAATLRCWSDDVIYFSNGANVDAADRARLRAINVKVHDAAVTRLTSSAGLTGVLAAVHLAGRSVPVPRRALFLKLPPPALSPLAASFGLRVDGEGFAHLGSRTRVPGLFICGDLSRGDLRFAITAAADGATAGVAVNRELAADDGFTTL